MSLNWRRIYSWLIVYFLEYIDSIMILTHLVNIIILKFQIATPNINYCVNRRNDGKRKNDRRSWAIEI